MTAITSAKITCNLPAKNLELIAGGSQGVTFSGMISCDKVTAISGPGVTFSNPIPVLEIRYTNRCSSSSLDCLNNFSKEAMIIMNLGGATTQLMSWTSIKSVGDFVNLETLTADHVIKLTSLDGLETLTKLTSLTITNGAVGDISAISGLTSLTTLNLAGNNISDLTPLSNLKNITTLGLKNNAISDLSPLLGLIGDDGKLKFTTLDLSKNSLEGYISPTNNNVETLRKLHDAGLTKITITGNNFSTNDLNTLIGIFGSKNVIN